MSGAKGKGKKTMRKLLTAATMAMLATACGVDKGEAFRKGVPRADTVKMNLPGSNQALSSAKGTRTDGLEGDTAEFYGFTRAVTVMVNGGVGFVLVLVEKIVENPPTSVTGNVAVWGPHTDPLSPNTWKLTVTQNAPNDFSYVLEGKGKTEADSAFRAVLSGSHVSTGQHLGRGSFLIDWEQAGQLPEHDANVGSVQITYSRISATDPVQIDAAFDNVRDGETGQLVDALYRFRQQAGQGGSLEFQMNKNFVAGAGIEVLTIRSRWTDQGAGRSDVRGAGGDLGTVQAMVNQCWDAAFAARYLAVSYAPAQNYGQESACAFSTAEYASL